MILVKKTIFATSYHFDSFLVKMIFIFQNVSEFGQFTKFWNFFGLENSSKKNKFSLFVEGEPKISKL